MNRLPAAVREAMRDAGAMATCMPVRLDGAQWEAAFFVALSGPESKQDRRAMSRAKSPFGMGLETDLVETAHGAVVTLRPELHTRDGDPLVAEILLTPGAGGAHHESLRLLATQATLSCFFADAAGDILHAQTLPLGDEHRGGFADLAAQCLRHDAMVRMTAQYDPQAALAEVVRHYALRAADGASAR